MMSENKIKQEEKLEEPVTTRTECMVCGSDRAILTSWYTKEQAGFYCPDCGQFIVFVELDAVNKAISSKKGEDA